MTTFSPALDAGFSASSVLAFGAVELDAPTGPIRLLDGAGMVTFGGNTFLGRDLVYGVLGTLTAFADGVDGEAPSLTLTLLTPTNTAAAALASPAMQGAAFSLWVGVIDRTTGLPVADPDLRFYGSVDVPTLKIPAGRGGGRSVELTITSAWDTMFADDEGVRLCDAWQQSIWPGDTGLYGVTSVLDHLPWGSNAPRPAATAAPSTGTAASGGSGFGGIGGVSGLALQPF